jgi:DNA-binding SARP family transcriptional activator
MTLREEFENEVKNNKGGISVLFETSNQHYIDWLENKVKALVQDYVSISLKRVKKYASHQHFRGSINEPLIEFEDWKEND